MRRWLPIGLLTLAGLAVGRLWLYYVSWEVEPARTGLVAMAAGTAARPFITRSLAPFVIVWLAAATSWPLERAGAALAYLSAVGWLLALWWLAGAVMERRAAFVAAICAAGPVGLLFVSGGYSYDLPTLALITLELALLARGKWTAYLVLFPWAVLCRETALLLVPVYFLWARRRAQPDRALLATWQLVCFAAIRVGLALTFRGNPGSAFETHLAEHLSFLWTDPLPNILALAVYGAAILAGLYQWRAQPPFLQAAVVIVPIMFAAYWLVGFPGEIRAVMEAYPVLFLFTFQTVWKRAVLPTAAIAKGEISKWRLLRKSPTGPRPSA